MRRAGGLTSIVLATAIAGVAGYAVTWIVYRQVGPAPYAVFAVFWAALYLVIGGLSGIQQEVTRATQRVEPGQRGGASPARNFAAVAAVLVAGLVLATGGLWAQPVFGEGGWALVPPLALGAGSYVLVATLAGSLYGISQWRSLAALIAMDGVLRLTILLVALTMTRDVVALAWVVAAPFPLTILVLWPIIRRDFVGRTALDVGYAGLTGNVARTVLASISSAVLVSGFPLLLSLAARDQPRALVGELIFTLTLVRAPIIVTVMSLQSYVLVKLKELGPAWPGLFVRLLALVAGAGVVLAFAAYWIGPPVLAWVSGAPVSLDGGVIAVLVLSSGLVACLSVSAPAVLAQSRHAVYTTGWVVAAVVTIVLVLLPIDFLSAVCLALVAGPLAGVATHVGWMLVARRRQNGGSGR